MLVFNETFIRGFILRQRKPVTNTYISVVDSCIQWKTKLKINKINDHSIQCNNMIQEIKQNTFTIIIRLNQGSEFVLTLSKW